MKSGIERSEQELEQVGGCEVAGSGERVWDFQRSRILDAMVHITRERGYAQVTASAVCLRAKVSRGTFSRLFAGPQDCFLTVMDDGYRTVHTLILQAFESEESWLDGVRGALASLLSFFDSKPALAYVLLVEASAAGAWARERREQHLAALTSLIEDSWGAPETGHPHPLVPAGVMASLLGILHTHLVTERSQPMVALLGSLMGIVTAPYLSQDLVTREIELGDAAARKMLHSANRGEAQSIAREVEIPRLLLDPRAERARACLLYLVVHPGASNRQIARAIGIGRDDQISTILARLARMDLLLKSDGRSGGPNAWSLSSIGLRVARALQSRHNDERPAKAGHDAGPSRSETNNTDTLYTTVSADDNCVKS